MHITNKINIIAANIKKLELKAINQKIIKEYAVINARRILQEAKMDYIAKKFI